MNFDRSKTACFSGHRSSKYLNFHSNTSPVIFEFEKLCENAIIGAIEQGYNTFIFGGCEGFDIKIAEIVNLYKTNFYNHIKLVCAVPFQQQADGWSNSLQSCYHAILDSSDEVITLSNHYYKGIYQVNILTA